jgi:SAM-dependent methyltransferase
VPPEANAYSPSWHETFSANVPEETTRRELEFLRRALPQPEFRDVLDVCCGYGRHARGLARAGYRVTGVERDAAVVAEAERRAPEVRFVQVEVRELDVVGGEYDAVLSMWASFVWFDDPENRRILAAMTAKLRPGGRLVLDVFAPEFHRARAGTREVRPGVREEKTVAAATMYVRLTYGDSAEDRMKFRLYEVEELAAMGADAGLSLTLACTGFDEVRPPSADEPRMQLVFDAVAKPQE